MLKLGQSLSDAHISEIVNQPTTAATPIRMGLTPGSLFGMTRSCRDLDVQANGERFCEHLRRERPVLSAGSPKCKAFMDLRSMDRRDPKFSKTFEAGLNHLESETVAGNLPLATRARLVVSARRSSSQLESEHQGVANFEFRVVKSYQLGNFMTK